MRIKIRPVRWWRDDADRFVARGERRHFNLSEVPRGDNPDLDAFVAHWRDKFGFSRFDMTVPLEFMQLETTAPEWRLDFVLEPVPMAPAYFGLFYVGKAGV